MNVTSYRRTRYQRLLIGPEITLVVSAIGIDPEGVGWVRLAVQTPDDTVIVEPESCYAKYGMRERELFLQGRIPAN